MALIKCRECGNEISDQAVSCPKCGCPREAVVQAVPVVVQEAPRAEEASVTEGMEGKKPIPKVSKKVFLVLGVCLACFVVSIGMRGGTAMPDLTFGEWEKVEEDVYRREITSSETRPFIPLLAPKSGDETLHYAPFMEDGKGSMGTSSKEVLEESFQVAGFLMGEPLGENAIKEVIYSSSGFYDNKAEKETSGNLVMDITLEEPRNGILWYTVENEYEEKTYTHYTYVINGVAQDSYWIGELPYGTRELKGTLIPKMFCESKTAPENAVTIIEPMSFEKEDHDFFISFKGEGIMGLKGCEEGFVIYSIEAVSGGDPEDRGEVDTKLGYAIDGRFEVYGYQTISEEDSEDAEEPVYDIQVLGYVPFQMK